MKYLRMFLNCTWGILQTVVGFVVFIIHIKKTHYCKNGSIVTVIPGSWGGICLGMFCFTCVDNDTLIAHEIGHSIQSAMLGPIWIFVIALPSLIWAGFFKNYRVTNNVSYYSFYTEAWADKLGCIERM